MKKLTPEEIENYRLQLRSYSNNAEHAKAYDLAKRLKQKYPDVLIFAYYEAVMTAEDDINYTPKQIEKRYQLAAKKLKILLNRSKKASISFRYSVRNEYYWFSKQPRKQYQLGVDEQTKNPYPHSKRSGYYSAGVGAVQVSKKYALQNKKSLALKWAKISERSWKKFHVLDPKWSNSYIFLAMALGYQDRLKESNSAIEKWRKYAKKPKNWNAIKKLKAEILEVHQVLYKK